MTKQYSGFSAYPLGWLKYLIRLFIVVFVLGLCGEVSAQLNFSVSPTPVGSGARAAGMADAFVAIADDATAASWNPAGLVQLERPELSIVQAFNRFNESFNADDVPSFDPMFESDHSSEVNNINFMSYVHPVYMLGRNFSFSLSYQNRYDFGREFNTNFNTSGAILRLLNADFDQSGSIGVITPSAAVSLTDQLSVGLSVNFWRSNPISENDWEIKQDFKTRSFRNDELLQDIHEIQIEEYDDFEGENYVFGLLWNVTQKWNLALRYDSSFEGEAEYERSYWRLDSVDGVPFTSEVSEKRKIQFPWTAAVGTAYRFNDRFTMSLDVSVSDWSKAYIQDSSGEKFSLIDGISFDDPASTDVDRTVTVRLGAEYAFIPKELNENLNYLFTLRGGVFYDEEPSTDRPPAGAGAFEPGHGKPDRFWGATIGFGLLAHQRWNFDAAYQVRTGDGVNTDFVRGVPGFDEDVVQHRVVLSTVIYF